MLCGGCADVCPALCLKLVPRNEISQSNEIRAALEVVLAEDEDVSRAGYSPAA